MSDWEAIRQALNTHQRLRFAGRDQYGGASQKPEKYGSLQTRCRTRQHNAPLLDELEQLFTSKDGPRVVALVGGPGSGKSYTAWMLYQRFETQDHRLHPFYLPLAYHTLEDLEDIEYIGDDPDLYLAARYIYRQLARPKAFDLYTQYDLSLSPALLIADDASLADPEDVIRKLVNNHIARNSDPNDRILLLLHNDSILGGLLDLSPHSLVIIHLCGFDSQADKRYRTENYETTLSGGMHLDRESWPMALDAKIHYDGLQFATGLREYHQDLWATILELPRSDKKIDDVREWLVANNRPGELYCQIKELGGNRKGLVKPTSRKRARPYSHRYLFTFSSELGLVFANSLIYADLLAGNLLAKAHKRDDGKLLRALLDEQDNLPKNHILADMVCFVFLSGLAYSKLGLSAETGVQKAITTISQVLREAVDESEVQVAAEALEPPVQATEQLADEALLLGRGLLADTDKVIKLLREKNCQRSLMLISTLLVNNMGDMLGWIQSNFSITITVLRDQFIANRNVATGGGAIKDQGASPPIVK